MFFDYDRSWSQRTRSQKPAARSHYTFCFSSKRNHSSFSPYLKALCLPFSLTFCSSINHSSLAVDLSLSLSLSVLLSLSLSLSLSLFSLLLSLSLSLSLSPSLCLPTPFLSLSFSLFLSPHSLPPLSQVSLAPSHPLYFAGALSEARSLSESHTLSESRLLSVSRSLVTAPCISLSPPLSLSLALSLSLSQHFITYACPSTHWSYRWSAWTKTKCLCSSASSRCHDPEWALPSFSLRTFQRSLTWKSSWL